MNLATEVPLLSGLPRVELARLLTDVEELQIPAGTEILGAGAGHDFLYVVTEGEVEVALMHSGTVVPVGVLGPGALFGEGALVSGGTRFEHAKALTEVRVIRLPATRVQKLIRSHPTVALVLTENLAEKLSTTRAELARVKQMLSAYMDEVWSTVPAPQDHDAAAAMPPADEQTNTAPLPPRSRRRSTERSLQSPSWTHYGGFLLSTGLALLVFRYGPGTAQLAAFSAVLTWAACNWLLGTMPDFVVALAACALAVILGISSPAKALAGYANPSWFLLLGVLGIGVAVSQSGLLFRIALHMLRLLPPTYRGQSLALALTGLLFTPLLPSANSRSALASPLARELSEAMRFPALGKGSAGLAMSSFLGFGQMYFLFLNGTNICLLAWSLLPVTVRSEITWGVWLWLALPLGLLTFVGSYVATLLLFPPEPTEGVSHRTIGAQLQVLGPMSQSERITAAVLGGVLVGFITQTFHGLDPAWVALAGFLLLVAVGVIDRAGLRSIDWGFLLLVGGLVSLSDLTQATGLTERLGQYVTPLLAPLGGSPYLFIGAVALLMLVVRLAVPIQQAVLVMVISLLPVATKLGYHPFVITLVVLAMSNSWLLPQQNSMYLTVHSGTEERCFTHRQVRPLALVQALVGLLAVLATVPFWKAMGLLP